MADEIRIRPEGFDKAGAPFGEWHWIAIAEGNHEPLAVSETYTEKSTALEMARREAAKDGATVSVELAPDEFKEVPADA
jgi:hypothetical protein